MINKIQSPVFLVSKATRADLVDITSLSNQLMAYDKQHDATLATNWLKKSCGKNFLREHFSKKQQAAFVVKHNARVVAYLLGAIVPAECYRMVKKIAEIEELFVMDEFRGQKLGEKLMQAFIDWAKKQAKVPRISVRISAANHGAIKFYQRCGFKEYDLVLEME